MADPIKRRDIIALNAVGAAFLAVAGVTAWRRRPLAMAVAIAGSMAVILMTWRSYADLYDPRGRPQPGHKYRALRVSRAANRAA